MDKHSEDIENLRFEAVGDALQYLTSALAEASGEDGFSDLCQFAVKVAGCQPLGGLDAEAISELNLVASFLKQDSSPAVRADACQKLAELSEDDGYAGLLKPAVSDNNWALLLDKGSAVSIQSVLQDRPAPSCPRPWCAELHAMGRPC